MKKVRHQYFRPTADRPSYAETALAILNGDKAALKEIHKRDREERRRLEEEIEALPIHEGPASLEDYNWVDEIDDFAVWFNATSDSEIIKAQPTLRRLVDSPTGKLERVGGISDLHSQAQNAFLPGLVRSS
jgi:hypothetical protein